VHPSQFPSSSPALDSEKDARALAQQIKDWGRELGFQQIGITDIALPEAERHLLEWLAEGYHGTMHYMECQGLRPILGIVARPFG